MDLKDDAVKGIVPWDGTLSSFDFSLSAHTFSDKWKRFNPSFPAWKGFVIRFLNPLHYYCSILSSFLGFCLSGGRILIPGEHVPYQIKSGLPAI